MTDSPVEAAAPAVPGTTYLVVGPYTKTEANAMVEKARKSFRDAYVAQGK